MTTFQNLSLFLLRISLGFLFLYAGITKILNPDWSAAPYLQGAKTFPELFNFFLQPQILPVVNILNEWGLTLIGISLILGAFVKFASFFGIILMVLYYLPILDFPHPNPHSYIVDEHIIYIFSLLILAVFDAGRSWGLGNRLS